MQPIDVDIDVESITKQLVPIPNERKAPINALLLGVDKIGGRSDTVIFASYNPETRKALCLSIPRDTLVNIPGTSKRTGKAYGVRIINEAYANGGVPLAIETVRQFLGVDIHYFARISYKGLYKIVDAIGGVPIDVEFDMDYDDNFGNLHIHLSKGYQILDGHKAEQYLRWRQNTDKTSDGRGDIGRISRQQKFMKIFAEQALQLKNLNIHRLLDIRNIVAESIYTNFDLSDSTLLRLIRELDDFEPNNDMRFETVKGEYHELRWRVTNQHVKENDNMLNEFWGIDDLTTQALIEVIAEDEAKAGRIVSKLRRRFPTFQFIETVTSDGIGEEYSETTVISRTADDKVAKAVAMFAGTDLNIVGDDKTSSEDADVTIVVVQGK